MENNNFKEIVKENNKFFMIEKDEKVMVWTWTLHKLKGLDELSRLQTETKNRIVFIAPFCLAWREKWYETEWEEPILAMEVEQEINFTREQILWILPDIEINLDNIQTNISDEDFANSVKKIKEEIENWEVNQVILSREFSCSTETDNTTILSMYSKLLKARWQYMTYLFDTWEDVFIWASPEKHLLIEDSKVVMNPIAWTLWKRDIETFGKRLIDFLKDKKEIWELAIVIDEELKMISKITMSGIIKAPLLKEAWAVIHTEADLIWKIKDYLKILDALRETLFAPTLVWWPIKPAFSLIKKYEGRSRWYYGWAFGIYWDEFLDTAIVIRTAFISRINKILTIKAWAWIVNDSDPKSEAEETTLKSKWFSWAITSWKTPNMVNYMESLSIEDRTEINRLLKNRENQLSDFYSESNLDKDLTVEKIKWKKFLLMNNWDDFVNLSWFMLEKMWWIVDIVDNKDFKIENTLDYDVVLLWPGYWNINNEDDIKMKKLLDVTEKLIKINTKLLWICLWHQAICKVKWFDIEKQEDICQWKQLDVILNWKRQKLWFYNSFSPVYRWHEEWVGRFKCKRVLSYRKANISSIQAHPESIMTINWFEIFKQMVLDII